MSAATIDRCDCGHPPTADSGCGTGYARKADGRTLCYGCSDSEQAAEVAATAPGQSFYAYLSGDGRTITTWSGGVLARVTACWERAVGFGGQRTYWTATDCDGRPWHGSSAGRGMCTRMVRNRGEVTT